MPGGILSLLQRPQKMKKRRLLSIQLFLRILDMCCSTTPSCIRHRQPESAGLTGALHWFYFSLYDAEEKRVLAKFLDEINECHREKGMLKWALILPGAALPSEMVSQENDPSQMPAELLSCSFLMLLLPSLFFPSPLCFLVCYWLPKVVSFPSVFYLCISCIFFSSLTVISIVGELHPGLHENSSAIRHVK